MRCRQRFSESWRHRKIKKISSQILLNLRELFEQGRKVAAPTHPAERAEAEAMVASLTSDLEVKELQLQPLLGIFMEAVCLREEAKKVRTEASDSDALLHDFQALQTEFPAVLDQCTNTFSVFSAADTATIRNESVHALPPPLSAPASMWNFSRSENPSWSDVWMWWKRSCRTWKLNAPRSNMLARSWTRR